MALAERPARGLADDREDLRQDLLKGVFAILAIFDRADTLFPCGDFGPKVIVVQRLGRFFEIVDLSNDGTHALQLAVVFRPEDFARHNVKR